MLPLLNSGTCPQTTATSGCYAGNMAFSRERILKSLARLPFIDAGDLAIILGEPTVTVHRAQAALLQDGLAQRVSRGTACLPSSHRYFVTGRGISAERSLLGGRFHTLVAFRVPDQRT